MAKLSPCNYTRTVSIAAPVTTSQSMGTVKEAPEVTPTFSSIRCRIEELPGRPTFMYGAQTVVVTHRIYTPTDCRSAGEGWIATDDASKKYIVHNVSSGGGSTEYCINCEA